MQTFLPSFSFSQSAKWMDKQRLNKQITETDQILTTLRTGEGSWINHPAVRMWSGHEFALAWYGAAMYIEFVARGGTPFHKSYHNIVQAYNGIVLREVVYPSWMFDNDEIFISHRRRLLHKGNLDVLRKALRYLDTRKPDEVVTAFFGRRTLLRDLTVAQERAVRSSLIFEYGDHANDVDYTNWYDQWGWSEQPGDDYFWPVELTSR